MSCSFYGGHWKVSEFLSIARSNQGVGNLSLKNNPNLNFAETEIVVEDVIAFYETLKNNSEVQWIRTPFANSLGGHVAVMKAPDENVFVLVGK